jgi:hypothetical protein
MDVDPEAVLRQTRPGGAEDLPYALGTGDEDDSPAAHVWDDGENGAEDAAQAAPTPRGRAARRKPDAARRDALLLRADRAAASGNVVRSALLRMRAYRLALDGAGAIHARAREDLASLVRRLRVALGFDETDEPRWVAALGPVLDAAAMGWWNPEARLLYDLQKVCLDCERKLYSVSVVDWLLDWRHWRRRRGLRRPLPKLRPVLACKHLRSAARRAARVRLPMGGRAKLHALLEEAVYVAELRVRDQLRPGVASAIDEAGLRPRDAVERAARDKLVEELLDASVRRGFFGMADVRDAISRNQLKLNDLAGPAEFVRGDQLLRADRRLADVLAGVYRRGEIYIRFFQRVSSLLFAWPAGRFVTRTLLIPFGGAFLVLAGLDHTVGVLLHKLAGHHLHLARPQNVLALGLLLLGVVNWPTFRRAAWRLAKTAAAGLRAVFLDLPRWLAGLPVVRAVVNSRLVRATFRYIAKPLAVTAIAWVLLPSHTALPVRAGVVAAVFLATDLLLNSRLGRRLEHAALEGMRVFWSRLAAAFLADLFHWVMHLFRQMLEAADRVLYQVDEWLRFRAGQGRRALLLKASIGFAWFFVEYGARFAINLLLEPQINPVKHFPVVTVSHKILLPTLTPILASAFEKLGMENVRAGALALGIVFCIPGMFGFLAWELKENWRLYRANRARTLRPAVVGSHGETLARLLRPGFHSGTVPKIFARLRRLHTAPGADPVESGRAIRRAHRQIEALHHVREEIVHFARRELVALLDQHPAWQRTPLKVGQVRLAATRIEIELLCPGIGDDPPCIAFEQRSGWILASLAHAGWAADLPQDKAEVFRGALVGLYRLAGVELVAEQVDALFAPAGIRWDVREGHLVVWAGERFDTEAVYELRTGELPPRVIGVGSAAALPVLRGEQLLLSQTPVEWDAWVRLWDPAAGASEAPRPPGFPVVIAPAVEDSASPRSTENSTLPRPVPAGHA